MSKFMPNASEVDGDNAAKSFNLQQWYLVYVKADSSASFEPREVLEKQPSTPLLNGGRISRNPLKSEETIQIPVSLRADYEPQRSESPVLSKIDSARPVDAYDDFYDSTVVFKRVSKGMTWKRLKGHVEWLVYEDPLV